MNRQPSTRRLRAPAVLAAIALLAGPAWTASAAQRPAAAKWRIRTIAGGGVGGPGPAGQIASGANCAVQAAGTDLYAAESGFIRRITMSTGYLDTPVGPGVNDQAGNGLPATQTSVGWSCGLAVDAHGNLLFSDSSYYTGVGWTSGRNLVRVDAAASGTFYGQPMRAGHVYTIAGDGKSGYSGDGGPAVDAELLGPGGIAVDPAGNVIVGDFGNDVIRIIAAATGTFYGQKMTAGDIYTVAGDGTDGDTGDGGPAAGAELAIVPPFTDGDNYSYSEPFPVIKVDQWGNIVLGDIYNRVIRVIAGSTGTFYGQAMTAGDIYQIASGLGNVGGIALDHSGNILVSDLFAPDVSVVAENTGTFYGQPMTAGHVYVVAGNPSEGPGYSGNGGPATAAQLSGPVGLAVDSAGNVVIADSGGYGAPATYETQIYDNELLRVVAEHAGHYYGVAMKPGNIYAITGPSFTNYWGDGVPATIAILSGQNFADPTYPAGAVATSRSRSIVLTDNQRIRLISATSGTFYGRKMVPGDIYTIAGNGDTGFNGDNRPAIRAELDNPVGLAVDRSGNVLFTDRNNDQVRIIANSTGRFYGRSMKAGYIYTIAGTGKAGAGGDGGPAAKARLNWPYGIALDHSGNVVVTDQYNGRIRVIAARTGRFYGRSMKAGDIYTVGHLSCVAVAVDSSGNLVLADQNRIRVLAERSGTFYGQKMKAGQSYVVAGVGASGPVGDGGPATAAFITPAGIALDSAGNILIADGHSGRLRVVAVKSAAFYGKAMKAGHIYTISGAGEQQGNGIPAIDAALSLPSGIAVLPDGSLVLDDDSGLIREISR